MIYNKLDFFLHMALTNGTLGHKKGVCFHTFSLNDNCWHIPNLHNFFCTFVLWHHFLNIAKKLFSFKYCHEIVLSK